MTAVLSNSLRWFNIGIIIRKSCKCVKILPSKPVFKAQKTYFKQVLAFALSCGDTISVCSATLYIYYETYV